MIKNERQYQITKSQLKAFEESLKNVTEHLLADSTSELAKVHRDALESQREQFLSDIGEYERLRSGEVSQFVVNNINEVPQVLIKARIALGLTQKELANRLEVKEQQVQRWEAENYSNATMSTLKQVISVLGVETRGELFVPTARLTMSGLLKKLSDMGLTKELLLRRILPHNLSSVFENNGESNGSLKPILQVADTISRIFGIKRSDLLEVDIPNLELAMPDAVRFKLPARSQGVKLNAYVVYAHYIASLAESCSPVIERKVLPDDYHKLFCDLTAPGDPITFVKALNYFWDHNVIVVPLNDSGAFHGAVWQIRGRFVILLKQKTQLESRWLYDLLHEGGHIASRHVTENDAILESQPISENAVDEDESEANEWAEDVLFDGDSESIEDACVEACRGRLQQLSQELPKVAKRYNINLGSLANHMAYRLSAQNENWWGASHTLQGDATSPFDTARSILLRRIDLRKLNELDRDLLTQALTED